MPRVLDAYCSSEHLLRFGYALYRKLNGQPIAVTEVVREKAKPTSEWKDLRFVGKVIEYMHTYYADPLEELREEEMMESREEDYEEYEEYDERHDLEDYDIDYCES